MPLGARTNAPRALALLAAACCACAALASSEPLPETPAPITDPDLGAIMAGLRSREFQERDRAAVDLLRMVEKQRITEQELLDLAARPDNLPEQRLRLLKAAKQVFLTTPRGAMGISFQPSGNVGVRVNELTKDFPAREQGLLKIGDVILSIDGVAMTQTNATRELTLTDRLRLSIIQRDPGESVRVRLRRNPDPAAAPAPAARPAPGGVELIPPPEDFESWPMIEVDVPLGQFGNLNGADPPDPHQLDAAWMFRVQRLLGERASAWPIVEVPTMTDSPMLGVSVQAPVDDRQLAEGAGRSALRDRSLLTHSQHNRVWLNAATVTSVRKAGQRDDAASTADDGYTRLEGAPGGVDLDAIRAIDERLHEIEQRIGAGAPAGELQLLRDEHRALTERLRAIAGEAGVSR